MDLELNRPIVFFDIESTGLDTDNDRIVELAAVKLLPDGTTEEKNRRFNPLVPIPREATEIHGITNEDVKDEPAFYKVAKSVSAFFRGCDLGGFNIISFDIPLLKKELERADQTLDLTHVAVVDVMRIFKQREPRTLEAAVQFYCGHSHDDAHAALGDVKATVEVLNGQLARYGDLPKTPGELDAETRPKDAVDRLGKLVWVDGEVALGFGKHKGRTLRFLAADHRDYIEWMINKKVADEEGEQHLRDALLGHFSKRDPDASP